MKKVLSYLLIGLLFIIPCTVKAANLIKDDLVNAATYFNGLCSSSEKDAFINEQGTCVNPATMQVLEDNKIKISVNQNGQSGEVEVNYNIQEDGKIVYNFRAQVSNGRMTKADYKKISDFNKIFIFPALLVSNARGAAVKDYLAYLSKSIPGIAPSGQQSQPQGATPTESTNCVTANDNGGSGETTNCVTIDPTDQYSDEEFPNHVMEIAERQFGSAQPIQDNKSDQINSFVLSTSFVKNDDDNGYIDFTMSIDSNADFTKVAGLYQQMIDGQKDSTDPEPEPKQPKKEDNPKTGAKLEVVILIGMAIVALVLLKVYGRRAIHNI